MSLVVCCHETAGDASVFEGVEPTEPEATDGLCEASVVTGLQT